MKKEKYDKLGFVMASKYRKKVVEQLYKSPMIPSQISFETGIRVNHISSVLKSLVEEGIVVCLNPNRKRGRVYALTDLGRWVAERIASIKLRD